MSRAHHPHAYLFSAQRFMDDRVVDISSCVTRSSHDARSPFVWSKLRIGHRAVHTAHTSRTCSICSALWTQQCVSFPVLWRCHGLASPIRKKSLLHRGSVTVKSTFNIPIAALARAASRTVSSGPPARALWRCAWTTFRSSGPTSSAGPANGTVSWLASICKGFKVSRFYGFCGFLVLGFLRFLSFVGL